MPGPLTTAVISVAGLGTRFLPVTRTIPKMMLPVIQTPLLHRVVSQAAEAGFEKAVVIISPGMESVTSYFDSLPILEEALERTGKHDLLAEQSAIRSLIDVTFATQEEPRGFGDAILMAEDAVGDAPFAVFLPDEQFWGEPSAIQQVRNTWDALGGSVFGVVEVPDEAVPALGIVAGEPASDTVWRVSGMVEKPPLAEAPSNLAIIGPYILSPAIFDAIKSADPGALGEVQMTDAIAARIGKEPVHACILHGTRIDAGTPAGMLAANIFEARNSSLYERAMQILHDAEQTRQL